MEPLDVNGRRGAIWMFVSLLLSASDCTGISYRDQTMTEPKGGTAMFFFFLLEPTLLRNTVLNIRFLKRTDSVSRPDAESLQ